MPGGELITEIKGIWIYYRPSDNELEHNIGKLHIGTSMEEYEHYSAKILPLLEEAVHEGVIASFKRINYTAERMRGSLERRKKENIFFEKLLLMSPHTRPKRTPTAAEKEMLQFNLTDYTLGDDWSILSNTGNMIGGKARITALKEAVSNLQKLRPLLFRQFNNSLVIYLPKVFDPGKIGVLCRNVESILKDVPSEKRSLAKTDLRLPYPHITYRQDKVEVTDQTPKADEKAGTEEQLEEKSQPAPAEEVRPPVLPEEDPDRWEIFRFPLLLMHSFNKKEAETLLGWHKDFYVLSNENLHFLDTSATWHSLKMTPEVRTKLNIKLIDSGQKPEFHMMVTKEQGQIIKGLNNVPQKQYTAPAVYAYMPALENDPAKVADVIDQATKSKTYNDLTRVASYPESYFDLWTKTPQTDGTNKNKILAVLNDYTKGEGISAKFKLFLSGHWNRSSTDPMRTKIAEYAGLEVAEIIDDVENLLKKSQYSDNSSLKNRLNFILDHRNCDVAKPLVLAHGKETSRNPIASFRM